MSPQSPKGTLRRHTLAQVLGLLRLSVLGLALLIVGLLALSRSGVVKTATNSSTQNPLLTASSTPRPVASGPTPRPSPMAIPTHSGPRIGIVAGHWQYDSGAVCPDGLREVDINLAVARRVVAILQAHGYDVDLLAEFDEAIQGYRADAFVAIHSDSCEWWGVSGFKVARVSNSAVPEAEDRLVECLWRKYERATGLARHENSITPDMQWYHAFRKIDPETPGAIIELGFMSEDRDMLLNHQDALAQGVAQGILCFLGGGT
ncbi:MAG: N-acetylmuramoyl-L-alanine amidase [Chloroflexi bacterium]|nr:N-acetylmuramoyl-L-alanine amidase [Chloroflexota bacterium]